MNVRLALVFLMGVAISGCDYQTADFAESYNQCLQRLEKTRFSVDVFKSGETIFSKSDLSDGPLAVILKRLLEERKGTWKKSKLITYSPHILFATPGMSLNVGDDLMVLNIEITRGAGGQYISSSNPAHVREILGALGQRPGESDHRETPD